MHDNINSIDFAAVCLTGSGRANGQIFNIPIDLRRRPYNIATLANV